MPDWIVHIAVAWTICRIFRFRYASFDNPNTVMAMWGSVLPDVVKIGIIFDYMGWDVWSYLQPLHLPVGSILLAGIISLLFEDKKTVFLFLVLGLSTHFFMDLLLYHVGGGMFLFYPFLWQSFSLNLVPTDDYYITVFALFMAFAVYLLGRWFDNRNRIKDG